MAWRDRLLNATYNDVPFHVDSLTADYSRRVAVVKLAGGDGAVQQDLGGDPARFDIDAYLVGPDYDDARNKLEKALHVPGPGRLVLPTRGAFSVRITRGPVVTEMRGKQGYAIVRFTAVIDDGLKLVVKSRDKVASLKSKASALKDAASGDFGQSYKPSPLAKYLAAPTNAIGVASEQLGKAQRLIATITNPISDFSAALDQLTQQASALAQSPATLASALTGVTESVISLALVPLTTAATTATGQGSSVSTPFEKARPVATLNSALRSTLCGLGDDAPDPADTTIELESEARANVRAVNRLVRATAIAAQTDVIVGAPFDSSLLALATLRQITAEVEALQAYSATDKLFQALSDYRAAMVDYLVQTAAKLPATVVVDQRRPIPALLLAHQQYGDARREAEIVGRNNAARPLEMSGDIEVLSS